MLLILHILIKPTKKYFICQLKNDEKLISFLKNLLNIDFIIENLIFFIVSSTPI